MTYDDMPVGTVLRCIDGEFIGTIVARDECGWTSAGDDGRCLPSDFGNDWIELVEKPAEAPSLRDRDGDLWEPIPGLYQMRSDVYEVMGPRTREDIEDDFGPVTEEPA